MADRKKWMILIVVVGFGLVLAGIVSMLAETSGAADVQRMTKEQLKADLDNPGVTVLDVRAENDWTTSSIKIKGAHREEPKNVDSWSTKYPKEKTLVLYCA
jgi:hypothetical protein